MSEGIYLSRRHTKDVFFLEESPLKINKMTSESYANLLLSFDWNMNAMAGMPRYWREQERIISSLGPIKC